MSTRENRTFLKYIREALSGWRRGDRRDGYGGERCLDPGVDCVVAEIREDVWKRLNIAEHIDTRRKLLLWSEERWPTWFKRTGTGAEWPDKNHKSLEVCMKVLWSDYLDWLESEDEEDWEGES